MTDSEIADVFIQLLFDSRTYHGAKPPVFKHVGEQILFGLGLFFALPRMEQYEIATRFDKMDAYIDATRYRPRVMQ